MRPLLIAALLAACTSTPSTPAAPPAPDAARPAAPPDAAPPRPDARPLGACASDDDCTLTRLSCGPCMSCPGTPARAMAKAQLAAFEAECTAEVSRRVEEEKRTGQRLQVACAPCNPAAPPRPEPKAAVCREGTCQDQF